MNQATHSIAEFLKTDLLTAQQVQAQMGFDGLDFSECTMAEFWQVAQDAYDYLRAKNGE